MPIFDYSCNCGNMELDFIVSSYRDEVKCSECGEVMDRAISAPNLVGFDSNGTSKSGKK
jgi:predicted nucleic acid-binding Zn ribbon protein